MIERKKTQIKQIVDSGAFSAWRLGIEIDIGKYCDYLHENADWIEAGVALDVICPELPEEAAEKSFANWQYMRSRGLDPIPVYHARENIKWLYKYLDAGATYIGLSASSLSHHNGEADTWYRIIWPHLVNAEGLPIVKTHAFGEGREHSLRNFPWYSSDSASWLYAAQRSGEAQLDNKRKISFRRDGTGIDASLVQNEEKIELDEVLANYGLRSDTFIRARQLGLPHLSYVALTYISARGILDKYKRIRKLCPIRSAHPTGFAQIPRSHLNAKGLEFDELRMHLVIGGNACAFVVVPFCDYPYTLSSYHHIFTQYGQIKSNLRKMAFEPKKMSLEYKGILHYLIALGSIMTDENKRTSGLAETLQSAFEAGIIESYDPIPKPLTKRNKRAIDLRYVGSDSETST